MTRYFRNGQPDLRTNPGGRPVTQERMLAEVNGDRTYLGKYCKKCGARERYTKGGACVACQRQHSVEARAALKMIGRNGFAEWTATAADPLSDPDSYKGEQYIRYFWHPESGALFTTDGEYPDSDGLVEEVDAEKYLALRQENCYIAGCDCPTPEICETGGCQGAPSSKINQADESTDAALDPEPEPWE